MKAQQNTLAWVIGGAMVAASAATPASAAENPFAWQALGTGYMVADNHEGGEKMQDGKCGTGKCGSSMKKKAKDKEGNCSAGKAKEGSCSGEKKAKEGSCGADKAKEGACGSEKK